MKYCARCVTPDTRPNIRLDAQGVCNACRNFESRAGIDWAGRARAFARVADNARSASRGYDCLIPVSGGKDSFWQTLVCLEHGLKPLCVTWRPWARTPLGQANLRALVELGVDHVDYSISPDVERRFMLKAYERFGSTAVPMHMALFAIPLALAARFSIPLVVWGENSAFEYGDASQRDTGFKLDAAWLATYGVTHGTTAADWLDQGFTRAELTPYFGPSQEELEAAGVLAVFLGYYFPWDPERSRRAALAHGFREREAGPRTGLYAYADIDDRFISLHHHLKWHKFGFTRLFDNLSLEIRHGRITRQQAVETIARTGDQTPHQDIAHFCAFAGIGVERYHEIAEGFRNPAVWTRRDGAWRIEDFLIPDWRWT
uniref:N-acetyl sugar amidotransferase n=1 Tax=Fundidesulfovibrio putealis TaxID=270496 RepID=A0A7C4AHF0_9BACT